MFVFPIGHENLGVRRLPWVALGIAAVCTVIQVISTYTEVAIAGPLGKAQVRKIELLTGLATACERSPTCPLEDPNFTEITAALKDGRIGTDHQRERFAAVEQEIEQLSNRHPVLRFGFRPGKFSFVNLLANIFVHGGFGHLLGNMLFLYVVGLSIEDRWGRSRFFGFYVVGGVVATLVYAAFHRGSDTPLVGASGAISAAMGAFLILFATTKIRFFYFIWIRAGTFKSPAWLVLPLWFLQQLWSISDETSGYDNVAYSAHAGGFLFGLAVAMVLRATGLDERFTEETDIDSGDWHESPVLEEARGLADAGDDRGALMKLQQLLREQPGNLAASELALLVATRAGRWRMAQRFALDAYPQWLQVEPKRVLQSHAELSALSAAHGGNGLLDDAVLQLVLDAALKFRQLDIAQTMLRQLYQANAPNPAIPKALWTIAQIHVYEGRQDLATPFLQRLVRDFPSSPWAQRVSQSPEQ